MTWKDDRERVHEEWCYSWSSLTTWHYHVVTRRTTKRRNKKLPLLSYKKNACYESMSQFTIWLTTRPTTSPNVFYFQNVIHPKKRNSKNKKKNQHLLNWSILTFLIIAWIVRNKETKIENYGERLNRRNA